MMYIWDKNDFDTHGLESKFIQKGFQKIVNHIKKFLN